MTFRALLRRDLTSLYRSRTGTAVAAILALSTAVVVGLMALAAELTAVAAVGALVALGTVVALVFVGTPRIVAGVVVTFTVLALGVTLALADPASAARPTHRLAIITVGSGLSFVLPLVGLVGSYAALVGERETGSVRFLLGLPNSRDDVYLGKYLSRTVAVLAPLVAGVLLAGVVVAVAFENGSFLGMAWLAVVSVPYAVLFVGVGLSASAYADTSNRAVAVVIAVFSLLRAGWPALQWLGLQSLRPENRFPRPEWYFWLGRVNPVNAYVKATTAFSEVEYHPLLTTPDEGVTTVATSLEFALVVLLAWTALAPLVGFWYFRKRDLL